MRIHDIVVIGAGPAGTTTALRLAELGYDVGIIEHKRFPRPHVGICISDQTLTLIEHIGVGAVVQAQDNWRRSATAVRWRDNETRFVHQSGFHVDRARLDSIFLEKAGEQGAQVYLPAKLAQSPIFNGKRWELEVLTDAGSVSLQCTFVVDAGGRSPAIHGPRTRDGPPLIALHADWTLYRKPPFDGLIEAGTDAWLWFAQTAPDNAKVSLFFDPREAVIKSSVLERTYEHYVRYFSEFNSLRGIQRSGKPAACNASSAHSEDPVGDHFIKVGDAALSIDPLASQGVHLAILSALQASVVINTILRKPEDAASAKTFYRMRLAERMQKHARHTAEEYARAAAVHDSVFWKSRAVGAKTSDAPTLENLPLLPNKTLRICCRTTISSTAVINGDWIEQDTAILHPNLDGPIKYLDQEDLTALLKILPESFSRSDLQHIWANQVDSQKSDRLANWLWQNRIILPV